MPPRGVRHVPVQRLAGQGIGDDLPRRDELLEIDARTQAHGLEHEDEVFGDDVAGRARRVRAAADPALRRIECRHAGVERGDDVREPLAARVVQVRAADPVADLPLQAREHPLHLCRVAVASRVGEADGVGTRPRQAHGDLHHPVLGHRTFHRAAERRGDVRLDADARPRRQAVPQGAHAHHFLDRFLRRPAEVRHRMLARSGDRQRELVGTRSDRSFRALEIGDQGEHGEAGELPRLAHDLFGVGHLRQQLRRHERPDLDLGQARVGERADPRELCRGRHRPLDALQPVARADLAHQDVGIHRVALPKTRMHLAARPIFPGAAPGCQPRCEGAR
jgi:hypothetical protein